MIQEVLERHHFRSLGVIFTRQICQVFIFVISVPELPSLNTCSWNRQTEVRSEGCVDLPLRDIRWTENLRGRGKDREGHKCSFLLERRHEAVGDSCIMRSTEL